MEVVILLHKTKQKQQQLLEDSMCFSELCEADVALAQWVQDPIPMEEDNKCSFFPVQRSTSKYLHPAGQSCFTIALCSFTSVVNITWYCIRMFLCSQDIYP